MMDQPGGINILLEHLPATAAAEQEWLQQLAAALSHLVLHDFNALVQLLYRVDVSEKTVKELLHQHPEADAGLLLARLLLQRQQQKLAARNQFKNNANIPDEERW